MIDFRRMKTSRAALATGAAVLVALGAAAGAGAVQTTRPAVEMAPTIATPIAKLASSSGVVTVKGRVAEVYGDRFVVQDQSGRAMVATGREARGTLSVGQPILVQGRYDEGQLRASYLVDRDGSVAAVGPRPGGPDGPGRHGPRGGPGRDGPPPPPGCAPAAGGPGGPGAVPPPPPAGGDAPVAGRAAPPPPGATQVPPAATPSVGSSIPRT